MTADGRPQTANTERFRVMAFIHGVVMSSQPLPLELAKGLRKCLVQANRFLDADLMIQQDEIATMEAETLHNRSLDFLALNWTSAESSPSSTS